MFSRARTFAVGIGIAVLAIAGGSTALASGGDDFSGARSVRVTLSGYEEDPGVVSSPGSAQFRAVIDEGAGEIRYRLTYRDLSAAVTQAHIHFGGRAQSGGISVWLCGNVPTTPAGVQACPNQPATITGTITAADVGGPAAQGIAPGEFTELLDAIRAGKTYANVHTMQFPGGEVRGQIDHDH